MIKAVIFDVDETLINTGDNTCGGLAKTAQNLKLRVPEDKEMRRLFGLPWRTLVCTLWPEIKDGGVLDIEYFNQKYMEYGCDEYPISSPPKTADTLKLLKKKNILLGIITSRRYKELPGILKKVGFNVSLFDYVEAHDHNGYGKPDPRVFDNLKKALEEKGIKSEESVYVGDAIYDYQAASGAGLNFVAFINGAYSEEDFIDAGLDKDLTIKSFDGLPEILVEEFKMEEALK